MRVAVVGAGYLGQHHARVYSEISDVELVGVVDTDGERAREVAGRHGTRAFRDYRDVLDSADALSIVVPTTSHFNVALDCLRAGKDILVEKPITSTTAQADELIGEARKRERVLQVGHLERYNQGFIALSRMVEGPTFLEAVRVSPFLNRSADVDVTLDLMIHDIDIVLGLVSAPVKSIRAFGFSLVTEKIDDARAWIEFENGTIALLTASRISPAKERRLRVFQRHSCAELDYQTGEVRCSTSNPLQCDTISPAYKEPLKEEIRDFIRSVLQRTEPGVTGNEGRAALDVALHINAIIERRA